MSYRLGGMAFEIEVSPSDRQVSGYGDFFPGFRLQQGTVIPHPEANGSLFRTGHAKAKSLEESQFAGWLPGNQRVWSSTHLIDNTL